MARTRRNIEPLKRGMFGKEIADNSQKRKHDLRNNAMVDIAELRRGDICRAPAGALQISYRQIDAHKSLLAQRLELELLEHLQRHTNSRLQIINRQILSQ